jgi:hypothetical protein
VGGVKSQNGKIKIEFKPNLYIYMYIYTLHTYTFIHTSCIDPGLQYIVYIILSIIDLLYIT